MALHGAWAYAAPAADEATTSPDKPLTTQEATKQLLARHTDYPATIQLEKDFHHALTHRKKDWITERATQFKQQDQQLITAKGDINPTETLEMLKKMDACYQASTMLYAAISSTSQKGFAPAGKPIQALIPPNLLSAFATYMGQCEDLHSHPRTVRLLPAGGAK